MHRTCIVVADGRHARFFRVESAANARRAKTKLVEHAALENPTLRELGESVTGRPRTETNSNRQAGPVHPMGAQRERHRLELEHRFGREIVRQTGELTQGWKSGIVVLIAEPRLLGLMREALRETLAPCIDLKELAKDYTGLTAAEIADLLPQAGLA